MADEFQNRKDIETLYNLIYARTSDSPVTQKSDFDEFVETTLPSLLENYVLLEEYNETISGILEAIDDLREIIDPSE